MRWRLHPGACSPAVDTRRLLTRLKFSSEESGSLGFRRGVHLDPCRYVGKADRRGAAAEDLNVAVLQERWLHVEMQQDALHVGFQAGEALFQVHPANLQRGQ